MGINYKKTIEKENLIIRKRRKFDAKTLE